jgi:DNA-binding response OmpR family regulator
MTNRKKAPPAFPDPKQRQPTILVVEDEVLLRAALAEYLRECGFRVCEAGAVADAIAILEAKKSAIDLVLSDVEMPGKPDGFELARWVRKNRPQLPILLAGSDRKKADAANDLCLSAPFFAKPYDLNRVVIFVRSALQVKAGKRPR